MLNFVFRFVFVFVFFPDQALPFLVLGVFQLFLAQASSGNIHVSHQCRADHESRACKEYIDWDGVTLERPVSERVQSVLGEVHQTGQADDRAVNAAERGKSKYFGSVVAAKLLARNSVSRLYVKTQILTT